jgi:hypothetical protein
MWFLVGLVALMFTGGCRPAVPPTDIAPKVPATAQGTISGIVSGLERTVPVAGRTVEIVDMRTGQRRTVQTTSSGGFAAKLPIGRYRLELPLREGEALLKQPEDVDLEDSGAYSQNEFVVGTLHVVRPRAPRYRLDDGLGSPIA